MPAGIGLWSAVVEMLGSRGHSFSTIVDRCSHLTLDKYEPFRFFARTNLVYIPFIFIVLTLVSFVGLMAASNENSYTAFSLPAIVSCIQMRKLTTTEKKSEEINRNCIEISPFLLLWN